MEDLQYFPVIDETAFPKGDRIFVEVNGIAIVIINIDNGYYAIGDKCSHDDGPIGDGNREQFEIICPRHGARFDIRSGKATRMPAVAAIPCFPVRVNEGQIEVGIPKSR